MKTDDSAKPPTAKPDEFDAFATALADALRSRFRDRERAVEFCRDGAAALKGFSVAEVTVTDHHHSFVGAGKMLVVHLIASAGAA